MILARVSIRRPVLMTMVILGFVVLGFFSYRRLVVDLFPEIEFPIVTVTTIYPGASPSEIETQVTEKIEDAVSTISNVKKIESICQENLSQIIIEIEIGVDVELVAIEVKDKVDVIRRDLPADAEDPTVIKFDVNAIPIFDLAVSSARPLEEVYKITDDVVREELTRVGGVASIEVIGGREREIQVALDRRKLEIYGLSVLDVVRSIASENLSLPAGRITEDRKEYSLRLVGEFAEWSELQYLKLPSRNDTHIELRHLGRVVDGFEEARDMARLNGENAVGVTIQKRSDANTVQTAAGIRRALSSLAETLPSDVEIRIARDRAVFVERSVRDVLQNILIGVGLTAVLLYLFLHNLRATFIAAVAMPASIIATFLLIDFAGFTINVMSLLALGVSIGVLVTNALVVLENITRHLELGEDPEAAAEIGTDEIATAVVASTVTNVVVFTPIAFMSGITGQFFIQFGLTVVFATLFSLLVSFTLTPMMAAKLLRRRLGGGAAPNLRQRFGTLWDRGYQSLAGDYRMALAWALDHPLLSTLMVAIVFGFSVYLFRFIGGEFIPRSDQGYFAVEVEMPPGTPLHRTERVMAAIERLLTAIPEQETLMTTVGGERRGVNEGSVLVQLTDAEQRQRRVFQIMDEVRPQLASIPDAEVRVTIPRTMGSQEGDIIVEVTGPALEAIERIARELEAKMTAMEGLVDVHTTIQKGQPEIAFAPHRTRLADYGIPVAAIGGILRTSFEGQVASVYREAGEEVDIRVKLAQEDRNLAEDIERVAIRHGEDAIPITELGEIRYQEGKSEILRRDKQRLVRVAANVAHGSMTGFVERISAAAEGMVLPPGYQISFGGSEEARRESFGEILQALILAVILSYMVLAAILESYVHPFTIMITLPLGLVGASFALFLTGNTISLFSLMALVMLVGIVVNNAILILDYTRILRGRGMAIRQALLEAAPTRLRPILMANLAIALGMLPQSLGGSGSEFRTAMAVVTMGGVLVSAVFTLFLIPVVYVAFDRLARQPAQEGEGGGGRQS